MRAEDRYFKSVNFQNHGSEFFCDIFKICSQNLLLETQVRCSTQIGQTIKRINGRKKIILFYLVFSCEEW